MSTTALQVHSTRPASLGLLALLLGLWLVGRADPPSDPSATLEPRGLVVDIRGPIGPATSDFLIRQIDRAEREGHRLVVLRMDTPGGLDSSMRAIIHRILSARVPVVTYVAPEGSRAASAGTYILYASHVAAMAPATNLGAATPVPVGPGSFPGDDKQPFGGGDKGRGGGSEGQEKGGKDAAGKDDERPSTPAGGTMQRKVVNDAVAYIRGLAKLRHRNEEWAERAVREAASLTAEDALREGVIDIVASDLDALLEQLDGRRVTVDRTEIALETSGLSLELVEPDWRNRILALITNPNVAYIFMLLGIYGLFFELSNPGAILPGVFGAISILIALYAFHVLPVNYAGVALVLLGIAFMVAEVFMPSFGALGVGGVIAFVIGSLILMDTDVPGFTVSLPLVVSVSVVSAAFFILVTTLALRQRRRPVVSGREEMVGSTGEAVSGFADEGYIHVHGERWKARSVRPVAAGQRVRVRGIEGLVLQVEPLEEPDAAAEPVPGEER